MLLCHRMHMYIRTSEKLIISPAYIITTSQQRFHASCSCCWILGSLLGAQHRSWSTSITWWWSSTGPNSSLSSSLIYSLSPSSFSASREEMPQNTYISKENIYPQSRDPVSVCIMYYRMLNMIMRINGGLCYGLTTADDR